MSVFPVVYSRNVYIYSCRMSNMVYSEALEFPDTLMPILEIITFDSYYKKPVHNAEVTIYRVTVNTAVKFNNFDNLSFDNNESLSFDFKDSHANENYDVRRWTKQDVLKWFEIYGLNIKFSNQAVLGLQSLSGIGIVDGLLFLENTNKENLKKWGLKCKRTIKHVLDGINALKLRDFYLYNANSSESNDLTSSNEYYSIPLESPVSSNKWNVLSKLKRNLSNEMKFSKESSFSAAQDNNNSISKQKRYLQLEKIIAGIVEVILVH